MSTRQSNIEKGMFFEDELRREYGNGRYVIVDHRPAYSDPEKFEGPGVIRHPETGEKLFQQCTYESGGTIQYREFSNFDGTKFYNYSNQKIYGGKTIEDQIAEDNKLYKENFIEKKNDMTQNEVSEKANAQGESENKAYGSRDNKESYGNSRPGAAETSAVGQNIKQESGYGY